MSIFDLSNIGLTEAQLLAIRDTALTGVTSGNKVITSVNAPGLTTSFQVNTTPIEILNAAAFALQMLNPAVYGQPMQTQTIGFNR
jgi:hypothetical protein